MKDKKSSYQVKMDAQELIYDSPKYYMDSYEVRRVFTTKNRSKFYKWIWNFIAWLNYKFPDGPIANMMYLSYRMGVYDEGWEHDMVDSLDSTNWE